MNEQQNPDHVQRPKGDAFGSLGETVAARTLRAGPLRTLRERQQALVVLCVGTLMIILDASVVNVALPSIRADLGFSESDLAWVVNAYLVPFGGLLLFGGRLGDIVGAKRVFLGGLALFGAASVLCGLAATKEVLVAARFLQGVGGALASSVVLGMIVSMFPKPKEQGKALAFYAFVASAGAAIGLLVGALLTEGVDWHWIFFVNVPICVVTVLFAVRLLNDRRDEDTVGVDVTGSVLVVGSLMLWVYTIVQAVDHGWTSGRTLALAGGALVLLIGFAVRQRMARHPLVPPEVLRARNVVWTNVTLALAVTGPTATFFLGALYLQQVLRFSVVQVGLAFLPVAVTIAAVTLKLAPRVMRKVDPKQVMVIGLACLAAGLGALAFIPVDGVYAAHVLPGLLLIGLGTGLAVPATLAAAVAGATRFDAGVRSGLVNTTQQLGAAVGLAVLATVATTRAKDQLGAGAAVDSALTSGYSLAFVVGAGIMLVGLAVAALLVRPAVPKTAPTELDPTLRRTPIEGAPTLAGAKDADFLALGLSGANMTAMLWSIAMGKRAVGVDLRGDPYMAVMHWNIREDMYHHLSEIDRLMAQRFGADRLPRRGDGSPFLLGECFYNPDPESPGDARADEVVSGWTPDSHIAGVVQKAEFVDDRYVDGKPARTVEALGEYTAPAAPDPSRIGRDMGEVLRERSGFQTGAQELLIILRRYLKAIEKMDLAAGVEPRCRLFRFHRVVEPTRRGRGEPDGFTRDADGRVRVHIEAIREMDGKRSYGRVRAPGTKVIDLGVPELFMVAEGLHSADAKRLGMEFDHRLVDHGDGRGPVRVEADYLVGLMTIYVDSRIRQRVASEHDRDGTEYWVRQVAIGHEDDAEIGWIGAQVPDFRTFDPILAGLVPEGTDPDSPEYFAGYQHLIRDYWLRQVSIITEIPLSDVRRTSIASTPTLFTVEAKSGVDALVARNGVVAGDSFGNGDFLTSGGINTGILGHAARVLTYWRRRAEGADTDTAIRELADGIKADTDAWIDVSLPNFAQPPRPCAGDPAAWQRVIEATRAHRRAIAPVNHRDEWSRINVFVGRLYSYRLPDLLPTHPATRPETAEALALSMTGRASVNSATGRDDPLPYHHEPSTQDGASGMAMVDV
ncbi:MFS transporter [Actinokineospora terrae]|uniref:Drug resistance transporter, EmrB/QacA subfamily n=1 Tax=Actinokineospora terrae TaxID=155974 RepID=A0A1H9KVG4_9PSEU|nr:MFS transporter [Actinokineospora terrae]SER03192.1 drug resistance transporter, EmrB/QacA subfamily [Actinokineospora terrae]